MPQVNVSFTLRPNTFNNNDARRDEVMSGYLIQELIKRQYYVSITQMGFYVLRTCPSMVPD